MGSHWVVVHGGYQFTSDRKLRLETAIERLKRIAAYAEKKGVRLLLQNHNKELETAERRSPTSGFRVEEARLAYRLRRPGQRARTEGGGRIPRKVTTVAAEAREASPGCPRAEAARRKTDG